MLFNYEGSKRAGRNKGGPKRAEKHLAAMRSGGTPVPIPNTTVKTGTADGTVLETVWESRWLPDYKKVKSKSFARDWMTGTSWHAVAGKAANKANACAGYCTAEACVLHLENCIL